MLSFFEIFKKNYYRNKGQRILLKGNPEKAYPYLEKALMMDNSPANRYNISLALLAMQKLKEAKVFLDSVVEEMPGNALAAMTLSEIYMRNREWNKARAIYEKLCEIYPANQRYSKQLQCINDPELREKNIQAKELLNKAIDYLNDRKYDNALQSLLKAAEYDQENSYIQDHLGSYYLQIKNDPKKAFEYFLKAHKLNPNNGTFKKHLNLARRIVAK